MARILPDGFLDDTLIPRVFIQDYLPRLGGQATKVYIYACFCQDGDGSADAKVLRDALGLSKEDFKAAVCELVGHELVTADPDFGRVQLVDLKKKVVSYFFRPTTNVPMKESAERLSQNKDRESLVRSINETYFHGLMGPSWYQAIDSWFQDYGFEPAVVYQMFVDASRGNKLQGPQYLDAVARDYNKNQVKSFGDLARYKEDYEKVRMLSRQVGQKLNKKMSSYDEEIVAKWVQTYGYDFSVIEVALRNAVRLSEPNLNYFDKILENWYRAGIKTKEEAENVEKNKVRQSRAKAAAKAKATSPKPDMDERDLDDDYFEQFYRYALEADLENLMGRNAADSQSGQDLDSDSDSDLGQGDPSHA
jgi:DnaD/phage-associated family protein